MAKEELMEDEIEKIDLMGGIYELLSALRKFWLPVLLFAVICGGGFYINAQRNYKPVYEAYTSLVVQAGSGYEGSYYDTQTAEEMGNTFSYVATSGVLREVVMKEMGVSGFSSAISAEVMSGTNLITISVTDSDPNMAYQVLQAVIVSYPEVTEYIVGPSTFTVVDESGVPTSPVNSSDSIRSAIIGVLLSLVISGVLMMIYSSRRKTIMNGEDLKNFTNAKLLGNIPTVHMKKRSNESNNSILQDNPRIPSVFKEAIRLMRSRLDKELKDLEHPVLLVTSSIAGEGKSMYAANLAIAMANKGARVALVDGDLRHPSILKTLCMKSSEKSLIAYLKGKCEIEDVKVHYKKLPLTVYAGTDTTNEAVQLIRSSRMETLIGELKKRYDYIIIDTPPSSILSDCAAFSDLADAAIFVVRQDYTTDRQMKKAMESVSDASIPVIGYVMNAVMEGTTGYGYSSYGYSQYGYRKYGYGYGYGSGKSYGYGYGYGEQKKKGRVRDAVEVSVKDEE